MGPALERLLARPTALRLLRYMIYDEPCSTIPALKKPPKLPKLEREIGRRRYGTNASVPHNIRQQRISTSHRTSLAIEPSSVKTAAGLSLYQGSGDYSIVSDYVKEGEDFFERLRYEADVTGNRTGGIRLVDRVLHHNKLELWLELLRFRKRLDGEQGVMDIWHGMRQRGIVLIHEGDAARALWQSFIAVGCLNPPFLGIILELAGNLAKDKGAIYAQLYQEVMGYFLREQPLVAVSWYKRLKQYDLLPHNTASAIHEYVINSRDPDRAYDAFKKIYKLSNERNLYDRCMTALSARDVPFHQAHKWHKFLIMNGDFPGTSVNSMPLVKQFFSYTRIENKGTKDKEAELYYAMAKKHLERSPPIFTRESMSTIVGDVHGIRQKNISDAFCARLFATGAFSMDFVISGLNMFGLETIGPLALREIAARRGTTSAFKETMQVLKAAGIMVSNGTFAASLQGFANNGRQDLFEVLYQSDQHPDTYEDADLQRRLLASFFAMGDITRAHATLAVIAMTDSNPQGHSWNTLLQMYCEQAHYQQMQQVLHDMLRQNVTITHDTMDAIQTICLRPRAAGRRPRTWLHNQKHQFDDLSFVTNCFLSILKSGQQISPHRWHEIMKRWGMSDNLRAVQMLCIDLAMQYSTVGLMRSWPSYCASQGTQPQPSMQRDDSSLVPPSTALRTIFPPWLQRAFITWGFMSRAAGSKTECELMSIHPQPPSTPSQARKQQTRVERWAWGVGLVRSLQESGISVTKPSIRRAVIIRLWMLYGPLRSSSRRTRIARAGNKVSLTHRIRHLQGLWDGELFELDPALLDGSARSEARLYCVLFDYDRRLAKKRVRSADIGDAAMEARARQDCPQESHHRKNEVPELSSLIAS